MDRECPVCRTAEVISGKWTLLIIRDLADDALRFCELERSLEGISPRTLSLRLRALAEEGIVERRTFPEVPPRVTYQLTDKGRALVPLIEDMRSYGRRWLPVQEREPAVGVLTRRRLENGAGSEGSSNGCVEVSDDKVQMERCPVSSVGAKLLSPFEGFGPRSFEQQIDRGFGSQQLDESRIETPTDVEPERLRVENDGAFHIINVEIE